jgi:hypothetical protein
LHWRPFRTTPTSLDVRVLESWAWTPHHCIVCKAGGLPPGERERERERERESERERERRERERERERDVINFEQAYWALALTIQPPLQ